MCGVVGRGEAIVKVIVKVEKEREMSWCVQISGATICIVRP